MSAVQQEMIETVVPDLRDAPLGDIARVTAADDSAEAREGGAFQSSI
jgi:hypothetical protein